MTNELSYNDEGTCTKKRFPYWYDAMCQATHDEGVYGDKRKAYYCWRCTSYHTSRESVKVDIGILQR